MDKQSGFFAGNVSSTKKKNETLPTAARLRVNAPATFNQVCVPLLNRALPQGSHFNDRAEPDLSVRASDPPLALKIAVQVAPPMMRKKHTRQLCTLR
jgi:hypothetical protein